MKLVGLTRRSDTNLTTERNVSGREIFPLTGGVKQPTPFINYMVVFFSRLPLHGAGYQLRQR